MVPPHVKPVSNGIQDRQNDRVTCFCVCRCLRQRQKSSCSRTNSGRRQQGEVERHRRPAVPACMNARRSVQCGGCAGLSGGTVTPLQPSAWSRNTTEVGTLPTPRRNATPVWKATDVRRATTRKRTSVDGIPSCRTHATVAADRVEDRKRSGTASLRSWTGSSSSCS